MPFVAPATGHVYPALQLLHAVAPDTLKRPAAQIAAAGVADVDPAGHAYPASQLVHDVAPDSEYLPAAQMAVTGFDVVDPAGQA